MNRGIAIALVAVAAAAALFFVLRPDDDEEEETSTRTFTRATTAPTIEPATTSEPATTTVETVERVVIDARDQKLDRPAVKRGSRVTLTVTADVRDHVHLHGYDLMADVAPGKPARITFQATITGRFVIELEDLQRQIGQLTVTP